MKQYYIHGPFFQQIWRLLEHIVELRSHRLVLFSFSSYNLTIFISSTFPKCKKAFKVDCLSTAAMSISWNGSDKVDFFKQLYHSNAYALWRHQKKTSCTWRAAQSSFFSDKAGLTSNSPVRVRFAFDLRRTTYILNYWTDFSRSFFYLKKDILE